MQLRPYQQAAFDGVVSGWQQFKRQLVVIPTGGGKTIVFSKLAKHNHDAGERTLILAHRKELIEQAADKIQASTGLVSAIEKAEKWATLEDRVVVGSIQTFLGDRSLRFPEGHFSLVIVDEAHHCVSDSWQGALGRIARDSRVVGFTATPDRTDKKNLGSYFETVAFEIGLQDLIAQGYLSKIAVHAVPLEIDLSSVKVTDGDYDGAALDSVLRPYFPAIVDAILKYAPKRRILVFLPLVDTSKEFAKVCLQKGLKAGHVDGKAGMIVGRESTREDAIEWFGLGAFQLLTNSMLLTEGYDEPSIDCVVNLRPTKSRPLYSQIVGRGTRPLPGKRDLLLLDFLWSHKRHNLIRPAHLVATSEEEADLITKAIQDPKGYGDDLTVDLDNAISEAKEQREESLRKKLEENRSKKAVVGDAIEFCLSVHNTDAADYQPTMPWHSEPISDKQRQMLERNGINVDTIRDAGHASTVIDVIVNRIKDGASSPKQIALLKRFKVKNPEFLSFAQASEILDRRMGKKKTA